MQNTINVFTDGLTTDAHPLTTQKTQLTDALNATFRTYNGNELILQNDMGNTMIQDSTTGNIMGLRDGFVPVGMKEHGGILYIASYNQETKESQLGTIPSPVINYTYDSSGRSTNIRSKLIFNPQYSQALSFIQGEASDLYLNTPFQLSDIRFQVGDQFMLVLSINNINTEIKRKELREIIQQQSGVSYSENNNTVEVTYSSISGFSLYDASAVADSKKFGLFRLDLLAKVENSDDTYNLYNITEKRQKYYIDNSFDCEQSDYWFIPSNVLPNNAELDTDLCQADDCYRTYPNILPGYLYGQLAPELPFDFKLFQNLDTKTNSPTVFSVVITSSTGTD